MQKEQNQAAASALVGAGRRTWTMFVGNLPNILAVAFLSGLLLHFLPVHRLTGLLGGGVLADGFVGAVMGSVSTGNPLVGYVLAGEFLEQGLGPAVVTALLVSWVTVGSVQVPAEIQSFGLRFALLRNGLAFASALLIALLMLPVLRFFGGSLP